MVERQSQEKKVRWFCWTLLSYGSIGVSDSPGGSGQVVALFGLCCWVFLVSGACYRTLRGGFYCKLPADGDILVVVVLAFFQGEQD